MQKMKKGININCSFCDEHPETVLHLFCHGSHIKKSQKDLWKIILFLKNFNYFGKISISQFHFEVECC